MSYKDSVALLEVVTDNASTTSNDINENSDSKRFQINKIFSYNKTEEHIDELYKDAPSKILKSEISQNSDNVVTLNKIEVNEKTMIRIEYHDPAQSQKQTIGYFEIGTKARTLRIIILDALNKLKRKTEKKHNQAPSNTISSSLPSNEREAHSS
ncbi:7262_t:CDS:2, partial [Ambispora leptoticha]